MLFEYFQRFSLTFDELLPATTTWRLNAKNHFSTINALEIVENGHDNPALASSQDTLNC